MGLPQRFSTRGQPLGDDGQRGIDLCLHGLVWLCFFLEPNSCDPCRALTDVWIASREWLAPRW